MSRVANSLSYQQLENADMAKNFRVVGPKLSLLLYQSQGLWVQKLKSLLPHYYTDQEADLVMAMALHLQCPLLVSIGTVGLESLS